MANSDTFVSSAIGTQRQFHKQEEAVYQMSLIKPKFGEHMRQRADLDAQSLVAALGNFSGAVNREIIASNKRLEEREEAVANKAWSVASAEDRSTLSAMELVNKYTDYTPSDSSYAVAKLDEMRGGYFNTLFKQEYKDSVLPNQPTPKNSYENAANYEKFVADKLNSTFGDKENNGITNDFAFNKGFYGTRPADLLQMDDAFQKKKQKEFEADRDAAISSKASEITTGSLNATPDELAMNVQDFFTDATITNLSLDQRIKLANEIFKGIATNGNNAQLEKLGDTIVYYKDDGAPVLAKDILPMGEYSKMANKQLVALNEQKHREFVKSLEGVAPDAIAGEYDKLKLKDPELWKAEAPHMEARIKAAKAAQAKAIKDAAKQMEQDNIRTAAKNAFMDKWSTKANGGTLTAFDGLSVSDNNFKYAGKIKSIPEDVALEACTEIAMNNFKKLPYEEAAKANLEMLKFQPAAPYKKAMQDRAASSLSAVSGTTTSIDQVAGLKETLAMYRGNPNSFSGVFTSNVVNNCRVLDSLMKMYPEGEALQMFGRYNEMQRLEPEAFRALQQSTNRAFTDGASVSLSNMTGTDRQTLKSTANNLSLTQDLTELTLMFQASGMTFDMAREKASNELDRAYANFDGDAVNKSFFSFVQAPNKEELCQDYINHVKADILGASTSIFGGVPTEKIGINYNRGSNSITMFMREEHVKKDGTLLPVGRSVYSGSAADFAKQLAEYYSKLEAPETKRVTVDDLKPNEMLNTEVEGGSD